MSGPGAKGRTRRTPVLWRVLDGRNGAMTRCQARQQATAPRPRRRGQALARFAPRRRAARNRKRRQGVGA